MRTSVCLCGFGCVGRNVAYLIEKYMLPLSIELVFVRNVEKHREENSQYQFTNAVQDVLNGNYDMVIECMGGIQPALSIIRNAMARGKKIVTANKLLLATYPELMRYSNLHFEAAVCGGIPIVRTIRDQIALECTEMAGVLNGTCNYILSNMEDGHSYEAVLKDAQAVGFAEADPSFDVDGHDAMQKLIILCRMLFGNELDASICRGIRDVQPIDIQYAQAMNLTLRHVAVMKRIPNSDHTNYALNVTIMPTMISHRHEVCVDGADNAIVMHCNEDVSETHFILKGEGAGGIPTANSIVADALNGGNQGLFQDDFEKPILTMMGCFCIRVTVVDTLGIVETIGRAAKEHDINIDSIIQRPAQKPNISFVVTTEETELDNVEAMIRKIASSEWYTSSFLSRIL